MVAVPKITPVTMPVEEPTVATELLELDHVAPTVASLNVVLLPKHATLLPVMAPGTGLMVNTVTA